MNPFFLTFIDSPIKIIIIGLLVSFWMTYRALPVVVYLSFVKKIFVVPNKRSSHKSKIPNLGGIGIFIGIVFTTCIIGSAIFDYIQLTQLLALISALFLLFFAGVKDDINTLSPKKKLFIQIFSTLIVVFSSDIRIYGFYGIFGIEDFPIFVSYFFTVFVFVSLINAYNLIDGIDGLAGFIALIIFGTYGYVFFENNNLFGLILSVTLIGSMVAFLLFNLTSSRRKIFMGDTGSMVVGFLIAYVSTIIINSKNLPINISNNIPVKVLALLSFPILDTIRIFTIRILSGKSPFKADKNHMHHRLLKLGFSHIQSTLLISFFVILVVCFSFIFSNLNVTLHFLMIAIFAFIITLVPYFIEKSYGKWHLRLPKLPKKN